MKIVDIFEPNLYSFFYPLEAINEFERLMDLWTNVEYLREFAKKNKVSDVNRFVENILLDAEEIENLLSDLNANSASFTNYFEPLRLTEYNKILSLQKGKVRQNRLRLYAIKVDENCFVITGGAIKMSQEMHGNLDTKKELPKLDAARLYLQSCGVFDENSFYELIIN